MFKQSAGRAGRRTVGLALLSLALVASALAVPAWAQLTRSMSRTINVAVVNGRIAVSEAGATIGAGDSVVVWRLQTAGYAFAEDGVVLDGGDDAYHCEPGSDARNFRCSRLKAASGQRFSYTINLVDLRSGGAAGLPQPHVWIVND
ncbi:MAG: hypothetical protein KA141_05230 [Rubrivivax sp.]|nr:hypothetical protein [Rubrivivax sp.]